MALVPSSSAALVPLRAPKKPLPPAPAAAGRPEASRPRQSPEDRLFELVQMIRDWIERTFSPVQEERLAMKGRLCARFQVVLGRELVDQLQKFIAASFALHLLKFRVVEKESAKGSTLEVVEVILSPEARTLYAEKYPEAVERQRRQLAPCSSGQDGLVDADGDEPCAPALEDEPIALEDRARTPPAIADATPVSDLALLPATPARDSQLALVPGATPSALERGFGRRAASRFVAGAALAAAAPCAAAAVGSKRGGEALAAEPPTKRPAVTSSVWEQCVAREVLPGSQCLVEAREAIEDNLAKLLAGGMAALKAEKELVSWLKGLLEREVTIDELKETRIGVAVNSCRKHREPCIAGLAASILAAWKRSWRQAEAVERRKTK